MKLTIWSHFEGKTWTGEVPISMEDPELTLELIFRAFNRVEEGDDARLRGWGYTLPSLSVGDRVTLDDRRYAVAAIGFREEPVTDPLPEPNPLALR